jgi:predicted amidohydrolase YtcJ
LTPTALVALDARGVERNVRTDATGEPTGVLVEDAAGLVKKETFPRGERAREALVLAAGRALELGVTSVQHVSGLTAPTDHGSPVQRALFDAWREARLPVRVTFYVHSGKGDSLLDLEIATGFGDEWLRVGGLKTFSDGALGAHTAKLSRPYPDEPDNDGTWTTDPEERRRLFEGAARASQQVATTRWVTRPSKPCCRCTMRLARSTPATIGSGSSTSNSPPTTSSPGWPTRA